jgi:hypothetical protein
MGERNPKKRAAIDLEEIRQTPVGQLTADKFLAALEEEKALSLLPYWPEKKKYELWVEPENIGVIPFERIIDILKGEKKKVEYEFEFPFDRLRDPQSYDALLNRLTLDIESRLRKRMG